MAFIYNLTDTWNDVTTTWNGIKLAVTNTGADSSSKLLNLTVTGASTASFVVDKSGNLALNGSVNKVTITAPATSATLTLADGSSFITSGAHDATFTFSGSTSLTFPTSGTVTALGNTTTGSGSIVLATSPTLVSPALGTPSSVTLTNATGLPISTGLTGTGTGVLTALAVNVGSAGAFVTFNGALGTPSSGNLANCTGYPSGGLTGLGTGVATALAQNVGSAGAIVVQNGVLGTPSSGTLTNATGLPLTTGVTGTLPVANGGTGITSFGTGVATALGVNVGSAGAFVVNGGALGTPSSGTLTNATGLPISTGVSGLGTGVATFLATPSSANLASAVTDETGSGPLVFATSPTFTSQITLGTQGTTQGSLVLANTASTYATTIKSSNSATAAYTLTLPTTAGTNGYFLQTDGVGNLAWAAGGGGGGGSVAGSDKQIQFNDAGSFGASANFLFDKTTYTMTLGLASTATGMIALGNASSANLTKIQAGNASAAVTYTLPTAAPASNGYVLSATTAGVMSWVSNDVGLAVGSSSISGGTSGRILYDNAGVLGELATTGSGNVVLDTSPTLVTPLLGTPTSGTLTNCTGLPLTTGVTGTLGVVNGGTGITTLTAGYIPFGNGTSAFGSASNLSWDNTNKLLTATGLGTGGSTATGGLTVSGGSFGLSGNISANAWTTNGIRYKNASATLTDLTSTGTVAAAYTNVFGGNTIAASNSTTFTDYFTTYISEPTAGTNVTFTNKWALGITGNVKVSGSLTLGTALSVANGGTGASSASITAFNNITGYTATGATGTTSTNLVFSTSPTLVTPTLGVASATSINKVAITAPATSATLTIADGKTLTASNTITLAATNDSQTYTLPAATCNIGYLEVPQNSQSAAYTAVLADSGKQIFHPSTDNNARTFTIPANGSVAYPVGTVLTFINRINTVTIAITTDTMYLAGSGTTGSRTLAANGVATAVKISSTEWIISGTGLT